MTIVKQNEKAMFNEKAQVQADSGYNRCIMQDSPMSMYAGYTAHE